MSWFRGLLGIVACAAVVGLVGCTAADDADASGSASTEQEVVAAQGYSLGLHEGVRASHPASKASIDTQKLTYSGRGKLTLHAYFEPKSEAEANDVPYADLFQVSFDLTMDEYLQLFESSSDVRIAPRAGDLYLEQAEATGALGSRKVVIRFDNSHVANTRKGELEITLGADGAIESAHVTKWGKGFFGWKKAFEESVTKPTHTAHGLRLLDDGQVGRLTDMTRARAAIDDPSPAHFRELVTAESASASER